MAVKPIPDGYHTVTPCLTVEGAAKLIDFLKAAFAATVKERVDMPDGSVAHAEVRIGDSIVMLGDAKPEWPAVRTNLYLYVPDVDAVFAAAIAAGATVVREVRDEFYGDRSGGVKDTWGNQWFIGTHKEDLTPEEIGRRMAGMKK
jgi:PhnB protein